jgi:hypothetical protein
MRSEQVEKLAREMLEEIKTGREQIKDLWLAGKRRRFERSPLTRLCGRIGIKRRLPPDEYFLANAPWHLAEGWDMLYGKQEDHCRALLAAAHIAPAIRVTMTDLHYLGVGASYQGSKQEEGRCGRHAPHRGTARAR